MTDHWRESLAAWAIPESIRSQAPSAPYRMDPALFRPMPGPAREGPRSLATDRALEVLPEGGSVLDVGCGGGAASLALAGRAGSVIGVDESAEMLALFSDEAELRGLEHRTVQGRWPDVASEAGTADVVVCHHVAYNVPDLAAFALALDAAASIRVVMELTLVHPQAVNNPLWRHFWDLDRPEGPTAQDAAEVIRAARLDAQLEIGPTSRLRAEVPWEHRVASSARSLCLGPEQMAEVEEQLRRLPERSEERAVIWWDARPDD
jgi:SAM-dependent methyltransferase